MTNDEFLTAAQVAARYGVTKKTLHEWRHRNKRFPKPLIFAANTVRYRLIDLQEFEASSIEGQEALV